MREMESRVERFRETRSTALCETTKLRRAEVCRDSKLRRRQSVRSGTSVVPLARVAPLKLVSIPRLELTAAVISVNVVQELSREIDLDVDAIVYYSDSTVVLGYIQNEARRFHVYVGNRVQTIRAKTLPESWHHVKSNDNPADIASRSATPKELLNTPSWLNGPDFLWQTELPKDTEDMPPLDENDPEARKVTVHAVQVQSHRRPLDINIFNRFSSWFKMKRAVALARKYIDILRTRVIQKRMSPKQNAAEKNSS